MATAIPATHETPLSIAQHNFRLAAERLKLAQTLQSLLSSPVSELHVELPIEMNDGKLRAFAAFWTQHNCARGPALSELHIGPEVDVELVRALAMTATWKAALVNVPFGGGAAGIQCDIAKLSSGEGERLVREFAARIQSQLDPYRNVLGLPQTLDESLGRAITDELSKKKDFAPASVVGKSSSNGGLASVSADVGLKTLIAEVAKDAGSSSVDRDVMFAESQCGLHGGNAARVKAKAIIEATDLAVTPSADAILERRGVMVIPDILANTGEMVRAHLEWSQNLEQVPRSNEQIEQAVRERITMAYGEVKERAQRQKVSLRLAAYEIAIEQVARVERLRGG